MSKNRFKRKLTAILSTDVVGYTALRSIKTKLDIKSMGYWKFINQIFIFDRREYKSKKILETT